MKVTSFDSSRWVPITMSTSPLASSASTAFCSLAVRNRESTSISHREVGQPLAEGAAVLLGQDRGGHQHRDLLAPLHRLEGGPDRDLGLAVADVAHEQPVHGDRPLRSPLDVLGGLPLVGRVFIEEARLELALPPGIGREGEPGADTWRRA